MSCLCLSLESSLLVFRAMLTPASDFRRLGSNLRLDLRAELAERNKQRERYRFLVAQEHEMQLRHQIRQGQMSGMHEQVRSKMLPQPRASVQHQAHGSPRR